MRLQIADLLVELVGAHPDTEHAAVAYQTATEGDADITITAADPIPFALPPNTPPAVADYCRVSAVLARKLFRHGAAMLHAAAVVVNGYAYLFSATSGTGKSTHAALWLKRLPNAYLLNDDKPVLRVADGIVYAYGAPWAGKHNLQTNERVPLGGICFLFQGKTDRITQLSAADAALHLYAHTARRGANAAETDALLTLLDTIVRTTPIFGMQCTPTDHAAEVAVSAMLRKEQG